MASDPQSMLVLLVEDTPDDERLAIRAITKTGLPIDVKVARDGAEAIQMLSGQEAGAISPTLVLLDLKLPKISGLEVLQAIRQNPATCHLPVVVLTSSDEQRDLLDCYNHHCNAYVRKAVDYGEYIDSMRRTLDFWLRVNRAPTATPREAECAPYAL